MAVEKIDPYGFKEGKNGDNFFNADIDLNKSRAKLIIESEDPYGF